MMFNTSAVFRLLLVTGGAATWAMVGCSGSEPTASNALSQEASIAAALEATEGSLATAEEDAKSCFETYRACKVAEAADVQSCRAALKACLPAEAPAPRTCGGDHPRHGGDGRPPRHDGAGGAGSEPESSGGASEIGERRIGGEDGPRANEAGSAGAESPPLGGGQRPECAPPPVEGGRVRACAEAASTALATSADVDDATNAHRGCLQDVFGDHIAHLCEEAAKICQQSDAHRDLCARLANACQTLTATP